MGNSKKKQHANEDKKRHRGKVTRRESSTSYDAADDLQILQRARALWQRNKLLEALALFEQALSEHPHHTVATIDASRAFGAVYQVRRAEQLLKNLLPRIVRQPHALHLAGQSYRLLRRPIAARKCFEAAIALDERAADTFLELAILEERHGELEAGLEHIERRLRLIVDDPEGSVVKARILRRMGELSAAATLLRRVADNTNVHWLTRSRAYGELAALLDSQQNFDEAWHAALSGKRVQQPHAAELHRRRREHLPVFARLAQDLTTNMLADWHQGEADDADAVSNVLLTGMPRSGTTLLERILNAHTRIIGCDELDAFPRFLIPLMLGAVSLKDLTAEKLCSISDDRLRELRRLYRQFIEEAMDVPLAGRVLVDKNPSLLPVITLYRRLLPTSRLVICLRDPRDVLVSCMLSYLPLNDFSVDFLDLDSAVQRLRFDLALWQELRGKLVNHWIEIRYEHIVTDMPTAIAPVLKWLNLDWDTQIDRYREVNSGQQVYSPTYAEVGTPIYSRAIGRWNNYAAQLSQEIPDLEATAASLGYD
jgi:tetratricopeptide (TPR) repeat protein